MNIPSDPAQGTVFDSQIRSNYLQRNMLKNIRIFLHQVKISCESFLTGHFYQSVMNIVVIKHKKKPAELPEFRNIMKIVLYILQSCLPENTVSYRLVYFLVGCCLKKDRKSFTKQGAV